MVAVSESIRVYRAGLGRVGGSLIFVGLLALPPVVLVLARLLPAEGLALALRLAAATACVLLVPGAIVVRALGRPTATSASIAGAFVWSLALLFGGLALTFALDGTIETAMVAVAAAAGVALVPALLRAPVAVPRAHAWAGAGVVAAGAALGAVVWWTASSLYGDALFHLGRVTKLESLDELATIDAVNEFREGGAHPGYAFPVWHGAVAAIARLAGVDSATTMLHLPAILTPLALLLAYAAGAALFRSWGGGIATAAAQAALLGFARSGTGSFDFLALPPTAARALLAPALLALVFTFVHEGRWRGLPVLGAASLVIAAVHPTYTYFVALPLAGFLLARVALAWREWRDPLRIGSALGAILVPASLYVLWLRPLVEDTVSHRPDDVERARGLAHYSGQIDVIGGLFRLAPEQLTRPGAVAIAGLLAIPLAGFAAPRRWAAYVLGGSLAVLGVLLVPHLFDALSELFSLSQSRRLAAFLPLPFALAGAATILGRLRLGGALAALGVGAILQLEYPGEFTYRVIFGGPAWPVWVAVLGGVAALVAGVILRRGFVEAAPVWTAAVALAFSAPVAAAGFDYARPDEPDRFALTPGLIEALRTDVPERDVVFSDLATSYRIGAYAPLYVTAAPPGHVADNVKNYPYGRRDDVVEFFRTGDLAIPRRYGATWIVINTRRFDRPLDLPRAYQDERFILYRVPPARR